MLAAMCVLELAQLATVRADGAFPDSLGVLLPEDQPHRIVAATNFGLVISDDDGASFAYVCEDAIGLFATLYQLGPPPDDRFFAVTGDGLMVSADGGCSWKAATGSVDNVSDVFPDPSDPKRVLAVAHDDASADAGNEVLRAVFESNDGGASFERKRYAGPPGGYIEGVEIARGDPRTVYLALYLTQPAISAQIARSTDSGASFELQDVTSSIVGLFARIIAVDPDDSSKVYLRIVENGPNERFGVYDANSGAVRIGLRTQHALSAFLRRSDGALIVGTREEGAFISTDSGASFAAWPKAPHLRGLAERDGSVYAVADDLVDGFALGVSKDKSATFRPLLRFRDLKGPLACGDVPKRCAAAWLNLKATLASVDAGAAAPKTDAGGADAGSSAQPSLRGGGCACSSLGAPSRGPQVTLSLIGGSLAACVLGVHRVRARSRRRSRQQS